MIRVAASRWLVIGAAALVVQACTLAGREPAAFATPTAPSTVAATASPTPEPTPSPTPSPSPTPKPSPRPDPPVVADEPGALGEQLKLAELALRDPSTTAEDIAWMGHLQQLVYRKLVVRREWAAAVIGVLPAELRAAAQANYDAGVALRALTAPRTDLPPWRILNPAPADDLLRIYEDAEAEFGIPWPYLASINLVETRMGRIRGPSTSGALGPMQFMPATWAAYGDGDINSDRDSIRAAARYLKANRGQTDMPNALFRYNHSDLYVQAVTSYAELMRAEPALYRGYYSWQVYYLTVRGDVLLPIGYGS